jgi:AbrB family looped-hinge helix DNA binding protein
MKKMKFYGSTTVGERGQIVLPISLRRELDINKGDTLVVIGNPHMNNITLVNQETMEQYLGFLSDNITEIRSKIKKK